MPEFTSNMEREQFEGMVSRIVEYVHAGDAFQVVPSQRWSALQGVDPFSVYRGLRVVNPSPYMYFLDFLDFQIAGASPEPLLTVGGRRASTRPIAGTRPAARRRYRAEELLGDEKERSEHVMLVDLGRNDLGRVCEYGTRRGRHVHGHRAVLARHAHRLVGLGRRCARAWGRWTRCARSCPAGTLSGAPKVRAMEIIDELEPVKRGGYGGAIGYLSYSGDLDTCIHIRTVVIKDGVAHIQAGGGTVADAKPEYEYEESVNKAKAVKGAIELAARAAGLGLMMNVLDGRQLRLVHLQPGPVPRRAGRDVDVVRNDVATVDELLEREPDRVVVSPGPCTPNEAGVSVAAMRRFPEAGIPTLGVCLGHQSLAQAFGGTVIRHEPVHGKTTSIEHDGQGVYRGLRGALTVGRYHSLVVREDDLPDGVHRHRAGGGVLMGIRHRELPVRACSSIPSRC